MPNNNLLAKIIVDGDIYALTHTIIDCYENSELKLNIEKKTRNEVNIIGFNIDQSIVSLFFKRLPQIVCWQLRKKNDEQIIVEIKHGLIKRFRFFYYLILCFLLTCFWSLYKINSIYKSKYLGTLSILLLVLSTLFSIRTLVLKLNYFINNFYKTLTLKGFSNNVVLCSNYYSPDFWPTLFIYIASAFFFIDKKSIPAALSPFLIWLIIIVSLLVILFSAALIRTQTLNKATFFMVPFIFCFAINVYGNIPILNLFLIRTMKETAILSNQTTSENYLKTKANDRLINSSKNLSNIKKLLRINIIFIITFYGAIISIIIFLIWIAIKTPIYMSDLLDRYKPTPDSSYYQSLGIVSKPLNVMIVLLWGIMSMANFAGVYFSFSIIEKTILGANSLFKSNSSFLFFEETRMILDVLLHNTTSIYFVQIYHKIIMLAYTAPILLILFFVLWKNLISFKKKYLLIKKSSCDGENKQQLLNCLKEICSFAKVSVPIIIIKKSPEINAETEYLGFPFFKNILIVNEGALNNLDSSNGELDALLAHEIWHIKEHTFRRRLLCLASDYTFFGNGFLAILQNSYNVEKAADYFAREWLLRKFQDINYAKETVKSLLEQLEEINEIKSYLPIQSTPSLGFYASKEYNNSSRLEKVRINLISFYELYFGKKILSYFHPPVDLRIAWIQEEYNFECNIN